MHIMVSKRYMWKLDTCARHEALTIELLEKKPPGIMSADGTSRVCEKCENRPVRACEKKGMKRETKDSRSAKVWTGEGDELLVRR